MDCSYEAESSIDIVKIMVSNSAHRISVVHAFINTKRCRTGLYDGYKNICLLLKEIIFYKISVYSNYNCKYNKILRRN